MRAKSFVSCLVSMSLVFVACFPATVANADAGSFPSEEGIDASVSFEPQDYASGEVLFVMEEGCDVPSGQPGEASLLAATDGAFGGVEHVADGVGLVSADSPERAAEIAAEIASLPDVAYVQPNFQYTLPEEGMEESSSADSLSATNDPYLSQQWYLDSVSLPNAWGRVQSDQTVSVAVLDSQFNVNHEDLRGSLDIEHSYNPMPEYFDQVTGTAKNHGTRVASILGAVCGNGIGLSGASYNANIIPVNVFGSDNGQRATTATIARGLEYVFSLAESEPELNIRVVNMSLGGYGELSGGGTDQLLYDLVKKAVNEHDMVVVAAGGNGNTDKFLWPSDWDSVVSVTAVDEDGQTRAWFSDHNEHKDIAAPGVNMLTADASGVSSYSQDEGTSFAAPLVSGTLALMFAANPGLTAERATEILYQTADDIGEAGVDDSFGHGRLNAEASVGQALLENPNASLRYQDVDQSAWYQSPIGYLDFAVSHGILRGSGNLLRPNDSLTRAEAAVVLWRVSEPDAVSGYLPGSEVLTAPFRDMYSYQWYTGALNWAYDNDIVNGYDDGNFGGNDFLSVEQFCTIMANWLSDDADIEAADTSRLDGYADQGSVSTYARKSVAWCLNEGIINGYSTSSGMVIAPQDPVSRARLAGLMYNAWSAKLW